MTRKPNTGIYLLSGLALFGVSNIAVSSSVFFIIKGAFGGTAKRTFSFYSTREKHLQKLYEKAVIYVGFPRPAWYKDIGARMLVIHIPLTAICWLVSYSEE